MQNSLEELFSLLNVLHPEKFPEGCKESFQDVTHEATIEKVKTELKPHILRRIKKDVMGGRMPAKKERVLRVDNSPDQKEVSIGLLNFIDVLTFEVTDMDFLVQRMFLLTDLQEYHSEKQRDLRYNNELCTVKKEHPRRVFAKYCHADEVTVLVERQLIWFRKCCNHPYLFEEVLPVIKTETEFKDLVESSGKLSLLDRMLSLLFQDGHRVLIFSQFMRMLDILGEGES